MADENLIQQVQKMLQEEKWTRETINNYTENKFKELSQIVENAKSSESTYDLLSLADEHLSHTKDSIIALYISGMLSLSQNNLDNSSLENLIDIFQKNHKENIVIHLCQTILDHDSNNKFALRTLAEIYNTNGDERVWALYEKIVKLDFAEAEMAKKLAEHYEKSSPENSIEYYKKAHLRYISAKNTSALKETWSRLVSLAPEDIDFFMLSKRKIAKTINENQTSVLLRELYEWYKKEKKWDTAIDLIKQDLEIEPSQWGRKELASCYRGKYEGKSHLEEYIKLSNLTSNFRNVFEAINDFEKHISFDAKNFVFHRTWGVGIIKEVANDTLTINFGKKHGKKSMALKMAVEALTPLSKDHIWVLKATKSKDELAKMVKKDKTWALKTIIKSFDNSCDFKRIKAELVPAVLSQGEWTSWSNSAKKTLESDSTFGVELSDINSYTVRDHDVSKDMKLINEFKAQKQFFARIDILMKYINEEETDKTSDSFGEMFSYFTGFLKSISKINEQTVAAYLTVQNINKTYPEIAHPIKFTFQDLYKRIESPREMYNKLKDTKNTTLKEDFIAAIRMLPDWDKQYTYLFPEVLKEKLLTTLINEGKKDQVIKLAQNCFENYKDNREAVIFLFKECQEKDWFKDALIPYEKRLIALANIIELTFKEINNHVNSTENKKINKVATDLLFKKETLITYMLENDEDTVKRMYTLVADIEDLNYDYKKQLRDKILEKYPNFKFQTTEEKTTAHNNGIIVTAKKLEEKKTQIEHIKTVELPKNAIEIAEAREQGDLKENAEYKAAREHQQYLNSTLSKLQEELKRATVFDPTTITTAYVSFSTEVTLHNNETNADEVYTILGPWESDPENKIISYMSPFGNAFLEKKVGDNVTFTINEHNYNYTVSKIEPAKI